MCDQRDLCQMFDYFHLLEGLEQGTVTDCSMIGHKDSVMAWDEGDETSCHLFGPRCCICCQRDCPESP